VAVQVLVAYNAMLAAPAERGRPVGPFTSGVVIGIFAVRFVAEVLADHGRRTAILSPAACWSACGCARFSIS
jgi:hypothetical protein